MAKTNEQAEKELNDLLRAFAEHDSEGYQSDYEKELEQLYPNVPEDVRPIWDRTDDVHPRNEPLHTMIQTAMESIAKATVALQAEMDRGKRMTPQKRKRYKNALTRAIHDLEELVDEVSMSYPLPIGREGYLMDIGTESCDYLPRIILDTPEKIIIWMKRLPSKNESARFLGITELRQLLYSRDLPHFKKWHCDFIHVYSPDKPVGMLDVDNYLYKPVIDLLAMALFAKDSLDNFSYALYNLPSETIKSGTYIHICKREEKVQFFQDFEKLVLASGSPENR